MSATLDTVLSTLIEPLERRVLLDSSLPLLTVTRPARPASENGPLIRAFSIRRTGDTSSPLVVRFLIGGKAKNGLDYGRIGTAATIPAGSDLLRIKVRPVDDRLIERTEAVTLTLVASAAYSLGDIFAATIRITDNDAVALSNNISWSTRAPSPIARAEALRAVVDGKLYVLGGFSNDLGPVLRSDAYDPQANTWTRITDLPRRITHAGTAVDGHDIYIAGGYVGIGSTGYGQQFGTREAWKYNIDTANWTAMPQLPRALASGGLAVVGRKLHYFGGNDSNRADAGDHYALDLDNPTGWTTLVSMPDPRSHFGYVTFNGRIYVIGGQHGNDAGLTTVKSVHMWNPAQPNQWTTLADLPVAVSHIGSAAFVLGNRIIIAGGETAHETATSRVTAFDPIANSWTSMTSLPAARFSGVAAAIAGSIYFTTGSSSTTTWRGVLL